MTDFLKVKLISGKEIILRTDIIREVSPTQDDLIGQCNIVVPHGPQIMGYQCLHSVNQVAQALGAIDLVQKENTH